MVCPRGLQIRQVSGIRVTASFFDVLGVRPMLGRTFLPEEEQQGRDDVVVLSHGLWTGRYGADPTLVGRAILNNPLKEQDWSHPSRCSG